MAQALLDGDGTAAPAPERRTRRWPQVALVTAAVVLLLGAGGLVLALTHRDTHGAAPRQAVPYPGTPSGRVPAPGYRLESSLGLEVEVPADWATNDTGCNQTDASSVVRGQGAVTLCLTPEPATKQLAELATLVDELAPGLPRVPTTVDGVPGERAEGRLADGRYAGSISLPGRNAGLDVRTNDPALTTHILDSLHVVAVDHLGCATDQPALGRPPLASGSQFVPSAPTEVDVCYYGEPASATELNRLQASGALVGDAARALADALNAAKSGPNPDRSVDQCLRGAVITGIDAVLLVRPATGPTAVVFVSFSGCVGRALDNGARYAQVTAKILSMALGPLRTGFGYGELPES